MKDLERKAIEAKAQIQASAMFGALIGVGAIGLALVIDEPWNRVLGWGLLIGVAAFWVAVATMKTQDTTKNSS